MKRFILLLCSFFIAVLAFSQTTEPAPGEAFLIKNIWEGFQQVFVYVNIQYCTVFIVATWLINDTIDAQNFAPAFTWLTKIPKGIRVLLLGFILMFVWAWAFKYSLRMDFFRLLISMLISMAVYKIGIKQVFTFISVKIFGFKFQE
jgi:hypothetical protein